jgi:uncharacterized protein (DUF362 family)
MKNVITLIKFIAKKIAENTPLIGIASLIWLLFRSGPKPSRLKYPCQQAALVNVSVFLPLTVISLAQSLRRTGETLSAQRVVRAACMVALFFLSFLLIATIGERLTALCAPRVADTMPQHGVMGIPLNTGNATDWPAYMTSPQAANLPVPNRVVSVHDSRATNWDHQTGYHWEYIDQNIVNNMMNLGIMALTGITNTVDAWRALIPYQAGDHVVLKMNFNNSSCTSYDNDIDAYPETANAVIDGLVSIGVPPESIWITDPSRYVPERFRNKIKNPNVQYYSYYRCNAPNYHAVDYVAADSPDVSVAQCPAGEKIRPSQVFVDAEHLINIPQFKSHGSYVTLALKNHYGSVMYQNYNRSTMHQFFNEGGNTQHCDLENNNVLADINNNPHIRDKTRLVIGDGLFGNPHTNWQSVDTWNIFNNDDPNILFFSVDPVAISSVMTDYIVAERGKQDHQQLHAAAKLGLGVHEHWDNFANKHYSAIDYQIIELDTSSSVALHGEPADKSIRLRWEVSGTLPVTSTWRIDYISQTGTVVIPAPSITNTARAYTLTSLTNYVWYTVTLKAILGTTPFLTDTVRVMPTDMFIYLPLVLRAH